MTPNILARTIETVEGGGMVVILLKTMTSFQQLYTMSMVFNDILFFILYRNIYAKVILVLTVFAVILYYFNFTMSVASNGEFVFFLRIFLILSSVFLHLRL